MPKHMHPATSSQPKPKDHPDCLEGLCPSCGQPAHFYYLGEQHWPQRVAELRGVGQVSLWICNVCESTIDGRSLHP